MSTMNGTILITGGTSGLGYQCALELAQQHRQSCILLASRSDPEAAATSINKAVGHSNVQFLPLDLSSLLNIRNFAAEFKERGYPKIEALVLNAGLQFPHGITYNKDGVEMTFAVNHVGHVLLYYLLRERLSERARIVITASNGHDPAQKTSLPDAKYTTAEELAHPSIELAKNQGAQRYATSKLCNVMWTYALHRRFTEATALPRAGKWTVTAFDPGLMPGTGLAREYAPVLRWIWLKILPSLIPVLRRLLNPNIHSAKESGLALARLAAGEDVEEVSGAYFEGRREIKSSVDSYDVEKQDDLWRWTAEHVARDKEELHSFESFDKVAG
jgi:NAD(P)-dependent dehydrogenase (short-subunit alcohol dehydrogenase family)